MSCHEVLSWKWLPLFRSNNEDRSDKFIRNAGNHLQDYMAHNPDAHTTCTIITVQYDLYSLQR
jgi:hypothetical protein